MTRRTPGRHDPNVSTDEWAERVDTDRDERPTRAEMEQGYGWVRSLDPHRCDEPGCLLCALQAAVEKWGGGGR